MPLPALAVPLAAGVGAALGTAAGNEAVKYVSDKLRGAAQKKADADTDKALAKIQKQRAAKAKKRAADEKKAQAKEQQDEARALKKQQGAEIAAAKKFRVSVSKQVAADKVAEKRAEADAKRARADEQQDAARLEKAEAKRRAELANIDEQALEKKNDAKLKVDEAALAAQLKKAKADDEFLQSQKVVVSGPPAPPRQIGPDGKPAPAPAEEKKLSPVTKNQKKQAERAAASAYAAQTRKLVLGGIGSGGRGSLDWLAQNAPGAVEARQAHNDAIDRELEKRKKDEEAAIKKVADEKQREVDRRADWKREQITGKKPGPPIADPGREYAKRYGFTDAQYDDFLAAPPELLR